MKFLLNDEKICVFTKTIKDDFIHRRYGHMNLMINKSSNTYIGEVVLAIFNTSIYMFIMFLVKFTNVQLASTTVWWWCCLCCSIHSHMLRVNGFQITNSFIFVIKQGELLDMIYWLAMAFFRTLDHNSWCVSWWEVELFSGC